MKYVAFLKKIYLGMHLTKVYTTGSIARWKSIRQINKLSNN